MRKDKQEQKLEEKDIEEIVKEEFEKELNQIIEENPDLSEDDIQFLRKRAEIMIDKRFNQTKKGYFFRSTLISFFLYFLSGLCILGFFFPTIIVNPKWIIFIVILLISILMSLLDSFITFIRNKCRVVGGNWTIIISPIILAVCGYFVNSYIMLVFSYHFIFSSVIVIIFILKMIIKAYLYKYIPKLRRSL